MNRFEGKVVLITGGSSGIGLASARLFRAEGAQVIVTGQDPERLAAAQVELGDETLVVRSDAGSLADIEALMALVQRRFGRLDVLFLNAAVIRTGSFDGGTVRDFDDTFGVNVRGAVFTVQKALPLLGEGTSIIVTTAIAGQLGLPNFGVYAASKAALRSFVKSAGVELIRRKIRVNAISPGPICTPFLGRTGLPAEVLGEVQDGILDKAPSQRFGTPDEVARAVLFLASEDSSYVVGAEIVVDGGIVLL